ncbi:MAG: hypothetical protein VX780_12805 [Pseudomonadota bacterium]|nr:hypothetical protein [Pseudomonadota bacterium]
MSIDVIPSGAKASSTALITAAGAPLYPLHPHLLHPKNWLGWGPHSRSSRGG